MPKRTSSRPTTPRPRKKKADPELAAQKREFIETFFKKGAEFAEELMRENERLRFRVVELEQRADRAAAGASEPEGGGAPVELDADGLRRRLDQLEREREALIQRFRGVEAANQDYLSRYQEIERENNNLANLYVASHQLHSTLDLRECTQTIIEILLNFIGAKTFAIQLVDEDRGILRTLASEGVERARVPERILERAARDSDDPIPEAVRSGRPIFTAGRLELGGRSPRRRASPSRSRSATRSSA
jgi:hypothetical protein